MIRTFTVVLCFLFASPAVMLAQQDLEKLIDELTKVSEPGIGYSGYFSGSQFLPYADSEQLGTLVLGAAHRSRSKALEQIVGQGAAAVPVLLSHLSDERLIDTKPMSGMQWMAFSDEYDFNRRTRKDVPLGVNRDDFGSNERHPNSHALTVGDLCFVALGQIVNRHFSATRYQPTGGLIVNSPTYSKRLRVVALADWKDFSAEKHRQLLVQDFEQPDNEHRRIGAYLY